MIWAVHPTDTNCFLAQKTEPRVKKAQCKCADPALLVSLGPGRQQEPSLWASAEGKVWNRQLVKFETKGRPGKTHRGVQAHSQKSRVTPTLPPTAVPVTTRLPHRRNSGGGSTWKTRCRHSPGAERQPPCIFCGFRYPQKQKCTIQGTVHLWGQPTHLTPNIWKTRCGKGKPQSLPSPKSKVGKGWKREEKWCFSIGFGLVRHVQPHQEWGNQNHHQKSPASRIGQKVHVWPGIAARQISKANTMWLFQLRRLPLPVSNDC